MRLMSAAARAGDLTSAESWFEKVPSQHRPMKFSIRTLPSVSPPVCHETTFEVMEAIHNSIFRSSSYSTTLLAWPGSSLLGYASLSTP